jgi:hypothetical protein
LRIAKKQTIIAFFFMTTKQLHSTSIAAILGLFLITENRAFAQQLVSAIIDQPQDQLAQVGSDVTLSVTAPDALLCLWMCNGVELDDQTSTTLTIQNVQIADAGFYSCIVGTSTQIEETTAAQLTVYTVDPDDDEDLVVFATPIVTTGNLGNCPGPYKGYVNYTKTVAEGWGWAPSTNTTVYTASDNTRTNTKVEYAGNYGDIGCAKTNVTIPYPPDSTAYRFTIYFTNAVPSTNYPITLVGFNP